MAALFHTPLTAPRHFVGTVDAMHDSRKPTARCLEQLQGNQRSSTAEIVPMADPAPSYRRADLALYIVGVIGTVAALVFNNFK